MYGGTFFLVRFGLAQYFTGDGSSVACPENYIVEKIGDWILRTPVEIRVRNLSRLIAEMKKKGSNSIWDNRTLSAQHAMPTNLESLDFYDIGKLGRITYLYFEK